jgi:hypothetical protein
LRRNGCPIAPRLVESGNSVTSFISEPRSYGLVSHALLALAGGIEDDLVAGSAIDVRAGVNGVREHLVDGGVARLDPSDLAALMKEGQWAWRA